MAVHKAHIAAPSSNDALDAEFLNERQLAERHRCEPKTLRNKRVKKRHIPFHNFGRLVRYRFSDVIAYEQENRVTCGDEKTGSRAVTTFDPRLETFLTSRELAKRHQRGEKTLRNDRVCRRYISFYKLGGQVVYALSDVLAYEHAHRATSTTEAQAQAQARDGRHHPTIRPDDLQQDRP